MQEDTRTCWTRRGWPGGRFVCLDNDADVAGLAVAFVSGHRRRCRREALALVGVFDQPNARCPNWSC